MNTFLEKCRLHAPAAQVFRHFQTNIAAPHHHGRAGSILLNVLADLLAILQGFYRENPLRVHPRPGGHDGCRARRDDEFIVTFPKKGAAARLHRNPLIGEVQLDHFMVGMHGDP